MGVDLDEEEEGPEEEGPNPEGEGPASSDANALHLAPVGGPVGGGDEDDPQSLVGRRAMMHFSNPGAWLGGEFIAVHPPDPPTERVTLYSVNFEDDGSSDSTWAELHPAKPWARLLKCYAWQLSYIKH